MQIKTSCPNPSPIRLMKMVTTFGQGGTEGQVNSLLQGLDRRLFELKIGCLHKWGYHLKQIDDWGIPVTEFPLSSLYKPHALVQLIKLARYMRAHRIQILHSYNFYSNVFAIPAARLAGVPVVIASIRDQGVYLSPMQRRVQRWTGQLASKVTVNADSIRDWLVKDGFSPDHVVTIRNGIDATKYTAGSTGPGIRQEFGIAPEAPLVVMLSRLNPQKGIDDFLKAAALVSRRHPEARFLVVGEKLQTKGRIITADNSYHAGLQRLTEELGLAGRLTFTGRRTDVAAILAETTVSVLPSHSEGIPNSLMESMASGVPVVATQVGGIPELIKDGEQGFLVPVRSAGLLAEAIVRLLSDKALALRCGQSARERIQKFFSLERMVRDTEHLYLQQLLKEDHSLKCIPQTTEQ